MNVQRFSRTLLRTPVFLHQLPTSGAQPRTTWRCVHSDRQPLFPVLQSSFEAAADVNDDVIKRNRESNGPLFSDVIATRAAITSRDNEIRAKDRSSRKQTVQERIDLLRDKDSDILDIGLFAGYNMSYGRIINASNVVSIAKIAGETCVVSANVWTFKGGTLYPISVKKQLRAQEIAMENRLPCIYLVDSGGAFLPLQVSYLLTHYQFVCV